MELTEGQKQDRVKRVYGFIRPFARRINSLKIHNQPDALTNESALARAAIAKLDKIMENFLDVSARMKISINLSNDPARAWKDLRFLLGDQSGATMNLADALKGWRDKNQDLMEKFNSELGVLRDLNTVLEAIGIFLERRREEILTK